MDRAKLQRPLEITFWLLGVYIAWQAVNFCHGESQIPFLAKPVMGSSIFSALLLPLYYVQGIVLWVAAGSMVMLLGMGAARIIAVGYHQFRIEIRESWAEEQRLAQIERCRQKRRELRQKLKQEKQGSSATGTFIIGAIIGSLFF